MLYFHQQRLAYLEIPKTGSSAVVAALRDLAAMEVSRPPHQRHMNASKFNGKFRPFIKATWGREVESFAVMREPVDRLVSWYRYLKGRQGKGGPPPTDDMSFADFAEAVLTGDDRYKSTGQQDFFLMGGGDVPQVNYIFQYDRPDVLGDFLDLHFGEGIRFDRVNVSKSAPVEVPDEIRARVSEVRSREAALWQAVRKEGVLYTPAA